MIKKFRAATIKDAINLVKEQLGAEAVILQTRKLDTGAMDGEQEQYEIDALLDPQSFPPSPVLERMSYSPARVKRPQNRNQKVNDDIHRELQNLRKSISRLSSGFHFSEGLTAIEPFRTLIKIKGLDEDIAMEVAREINFRQPIGKKSEFKIPDDAITKVMTKYLRFNRNIELPPNRPKIVFLVGPTGIGKTTTMIKLATHPEIYGRKRVALITIDTYRVAAAAQLKMFSTLAQLPLEVAYTPSEFSNALEKFKDQDVILVDTAGRSPSDREHIAKLQSFTQLFTPDEIHLVLSVSMRSDSSVDAAKSFCSLPVNRLILSKFDETQRVGNVFNIAQKINLPISFFTTGQSIPDDIVTGNSNFVIDSMLGSMKAQEI